MDRWDVFVSYARRDAARVRPLASALTAYGLRVFLDERGVRDFRSLSRIIGTELGRAKVLLAYYSTTYPTRPACQWELTVAYLAGQREGDPLRRVLVVNPEPAAGHIHPVELRDTRRWPGLTRASLADHVRQVATHVRGLAGPIGLASAGSPPPWLPAPRPPGGTGPVVGPELLWRVHSALQPQAAPMLTGRPHAGTAVLQGGGGSAIAREYAVRFGAAYQGGIFWLSLADQPDPVAAYARQLVRIGAALDLALPAAEPATALSRLAAEFARLPLARLWVVDGVPDGLRRDELALLVAPHPLAATLVTTGAAGYGWLGEPIGAGPPPAADTMVPMSTISESTAERERLAAFDLQVELVTRVGVQHLAAGDGLLREALDSLHGLVHTTREVLHGYGPATPRVHPPADALINDVLRSFLGYWHPRLSAHEARRPAELSRWEHEQQWADAGRLRAELAGLAEPLNRVVARLSEISGSALGLTGNRSG